MATAMVAIAPTQAASVSVPSNVTTDYYDRCYQPGEACWRLNIISEMMTFPSAQQMRDGTGYGEGTASGVDVVGEMTMIDAMDEVMKKFHRWCYRAGEPCW